MIARMDDLPAPERPISSTLRCFWRLPRSGVLISRFVAGGCERLGEVVYIAVYLDALLSRCTDGAQALKHSRTLAVTTGLGTDFRRPSTTSNAALVPVFQPVSKTLLSLLHQKDASPFRCRRLKALDKILRRTRHLALQRYQRLTRVFHVDCFKFVISSNVTLTMMQKSLRVFSGDIASSWRVFYIARQHVCSERPAAASNMKLAMLHLPCIKVRQGRTSNVSGH